MKRLVIFAGLLAACAKAPEEATIRDVRPTKLERGDKFLVEANTPNFAVGAPTTLTFNRILGVDGKPVTIEARAVAGDRVIADADEKLEKKLGGYHVVMRSSVTVKQTVNGREYVNS